MKVRYFSFLVFCLLAFFPLQASQDGFIAKANPKSSPWTRYKFPQYKVSYPATWGVISLSNLQKILSFNGDDLFLDPAYEGPSFARGWYSNIGGANFATSVIYQQGVNANFSLEAYFQSVLANTQTPVQNATHWKIVRSGSIKLSHGVRAKWLITKYQLNGRRFKEIDYYIASKRYLFVLTFVASAHHFHGLRHTFKKSALSFVARK